MTTYKAIEKLETTQEALANLGIYALEKQDLKSILNRAIDISCIILQQDCAVIFSFDQEANTLQVKEQAGCAAAKDPLEIVNKWDIGYAIQQEEPTVVENYNSEERFQLSPFLTDQDIKSSINIVVKGSGDSLGLLGFYSKEEKIFTEQEIHFLQIVANMVGMAIERDQHRQELNAANEGLREEMRRSRRYQREILKNSVSQRWELGSFLHDNLAQLLVSAQINIDTIRKNFSDPPEDILKELTEIDHMLEEGISGIRNLTSYIIPIDMEEEGVAHAYRFLIKQTQKIHDIRCHLETGEVIHEIENIEVATNLYHIIQEAIKNAAVHGQADHVNIKMSKPDGELIIQIEDNGSGLSDKSNKEGGNGLRIMKHRMDLLGGKFLIEDKPDAGNTGTIITCTLPLKYLTEKDAKPTED